MQQQGGVALGQIACAIRAASALDDGVWDCLRSRWHRPCLLDYKACMFAVDRQRRLVERLVTSSPKAWTTLKKELELHPELEDAIGVARNITSRRTGEARARQCKHAAKMLMTKHDAGERQEIHVRDCRGYFC